MMRRLFIVAAAVASIVGCASQPSPVHQPTTSLLVGIDSPSARVLIKSVDNGPTLWQSSGALGSKVTIVPGHHTVEVVCESEQSLHFATGDVTIDVLPGHTYDLVGSVSPGATRCNVAATIRG